MQQPKAWIVASALAAVCASLPAAAASDLADPVNSIELADSLRLVGFGLTADQRIVQFQVAIPQVVTPVGQVTGLDSADSALVGIDFRVQDGMLYGVGNGGGVYRINTRNAQATLVSRLTVGLQGNSFGVDFNPAANALRIVSDSGQNLRHPFAGATMFQTQVDGALNTGGTPASGVVGAAYTNNDLMPETGTTLYDISATGDQLLLQSPPNAGSLAAVGSLTVDAGTMTGFDIYSRLVNGTTVRNSGFATLEVGGQRGLYRVNLTTGRASLIGSFGDAVVDLAIALNQ